MAGAPVARESRQLQLSSSSRHWSAPTAQYVSVSHHCLQEEELHRRIREAEKLHTRAVQQDQRHAQELAALTAELQQSRSAVAASSSQASETTSRLVEAESSVRVLAEELERARGAHARECAALAERLDAGQRELQALALSHRRSNEQLSEQLRSKAGTLSVRI